MYKISKRVFLLQFAGQETGFEYRKEALHYTMGVEYFDQMGDS
jgi:hypothetical protein